MSTDSHSPNLYHRGVLCNAGAGAAAGISISVKHYSPLFYFQFYRDYVTKVLIFILKI